ncbi:hypothetical protein CB0940_02609 [Cercospora beticola]|uniref:Uncharacterized protein n=1 Tax=Cercospora beticola TaxID=122368 RepID=A0A2G5I4U5_CERBT|nr:hypothetical protein CB0940_02609 [Cercospora beticola]PIA99503.1 hypothetical protein CB0940_02609 [Cercospora beticola]
MAGGGDVAYRIPRACPSTYEVPAGDPQLYRPHWKPDRANGGREDDNPRSDDVRCKSTEHPRHDRYLRRAARDA